MARAALAAASPFCLESGRREWRDGRDKSGGKEKVVVETGSRRRQQIRERREIEKRWEGERKGKSW